MSGTLQQRIAAIKQRVDLPALIGRHVKLRKAGREYIGLCPFHQEKTGSFTVSGDKGFYHCFGCQAHGDALSWMTQHGGLPFADALAALEAQCGLGGADHAPRTPAPQSMQRESVRPVREDVFIASAEAARVVWRAGQAAHGSLVGNYLKARGIDPAASGILDVVRFHPRCPAALWRHGEGPDAAARHAPAMLSPICALREGRWIMQGLHLTFLAADGRGKAKFPARQDRNGKAQRPPARKIWGEAGRGCVPVPPRHWRGNWRDPAWLGGTGELVIAEGIESTLALMAMIDPARGAAATLSLGNLQGHWIEDGPRLDGRPALCLWNLRPDLARTLPFTLPDAGDVTIGIDADMAGLSGRAVQERPGAKPVRRDLSGAERSEICAQLAALAWKHAGARRVRVLRPRMGRDFNDEAMVSRQAGERVS